MIEKSVAVSRARGRTVITSTTAIIALGDVVEVLIVSSQTTMGKKKGEAAASQRKLPLADPPYLACRPQDATAAPPQ